jgi:CheY-like chemotaxis protein
VGRVLVLEPDPDVRTLLERLLRHLGHEPIADGVRPESIDLILLEPTSPEALVAARAVRASNPGVGVVCASIYPRERVPEDFRFAPHLVKPVPLNEFDRALKAALAEAHPDAPGHSPPPAGAD